MLTYRVVRAILLTGLKAFFRWGLDGTSRIPRRGPAIVAANHISYFDPLCHAYMIDRAGRWPRFFAKAELWKNPFLRFILKHCRQIPVQRGTGEAGPVEKAIEEIARGNLVVIYPEATITTNTDLTPMRGKTGVARVAIATGAPVIPVAVWGSQWVKPKRRRAVQKFRRLIVMKAGEPMVFDDPGLKSRTDDPGTLHEVTDRIVAELDRLVRELHKVYPEGAAVPEMKDIG